MCGIAGWYGKQDAQDGRVLLKSMLSELVHRGPDDEGMYVEGPIALGNRRLAIIDVAGGHQPIPNEDRTIWVVLNGEIYNFPELRKELESRGHKFASKTDTEVIVHGYEEWGDECIAKLNGIFGVAIWDAPRRRLVLARDHYGVKPLYYYDDGRRISWGSEVKAVLADPSVPRAVDLEALDLFLTFRYVPAPRTLFSKISKLAPGHLLIRDDNGTRVERFFKPTKLSKVKLTENDWIALLQERLETAVRRQMMSDVPIGALLSGGVDSGVIVAIMSKYTDHPVRTFTVGFAGSDDLNELDEARQTAAMFGAKHEEIVLSSLDYQDLLQKITWHLDEPNASMSALAMYSVCKLAREHVTVALTGQGADEPFAGYPRYLGERYGTWYRRLPRPLRDQVLRPLVESLPRHERHKRAVRSLGTEDVTGRFAQVYAVFSESMKAELWKPGMADPHAVEHVRELIDYWRQGIEDRHPMEQMAYIDCRMSLSDDLLTYGDKMSMAASIEARVPFLDLEYMEVAEAIPANLRINGRTHKYIHKKACAKWLPPEILYRKKRGFDTPVDRWFRSELTGYVRTMMLSSDSACMQYFQPQPIENLIADHVSGRQDNQRQIFSLLMFELWHRQFIGGANGRGAYVPGELETVRS